MSDATKSDQPSAWLPVPRRLSRTLAAVLLCGPLPMTVATAAPAQATVGDLTCNVNVQLNFSPPLTPTQTTSRAVAVANVVNCISPNGAYSYLKSGSVNDATATITSLGGAPCNLLLTITGRATIDWSPSGQHTTFDFTVNTNPTNGSITLMTTQTSGPLTGDISQTVGAANPNLDCAINGLTSLSVPIGQTTFL